MATKMIDKKLTLVLTILVSACVALCLCLCPLSTDIAEAKTVSKKITKITTKGTYTYTGKKITVKVKVYAGKTKVTSKNYKTSYYVKNNKKWKKIKKSSIKAVGTYKVKVTAKKSYKGSKSRTFKVVKYSTNPTKTNTTNQATHTHKWVAQTKSVRYMTDTDFAEGAKYGCSVVNGESTKGTCGTIGSSAEQVNDHLEAHPECVLTWNEHMIGTWFKCGYIAKTIDEYEAHRMLGGTHLTEPTGSAIADVIKHPASTHTKTITDGYKCSCGATK